jgi:hypothetical protein
MIILAMNFQSTKPNFHATNANKDGNITSSQLVECIDIML